MTPEFKKRFPDNYGSRVHPKAPDYSRCCASVRDGYRGKQCSRKNGYGPDGAYCRQHDPVLRQAKRDKEHEARIKDYRAREERNRRGRVEVNGFYPLLDVVHKIALGSNDARQLAAAALDAFGEDRAWFLENLQREMKR